MPAGAEAYGAWWDERAAQAACAFFPRYLRHTEAEWAGQPFTLQPWQRDRILRPIFGWRRADGTRLVRVVWIEVPRKNGKTELAAGIALLLLVGDAESGGQVYAMAVDKDQAKIVFGKAGVMVGLSDDLRRHIEVYKTAIFCPQLMASFKPLSKGVGGKHGFSPSAAIGDEVHEWRDGELADVVHKGTAARRQPLEIYITTSGIAGDGYGWEMHELAAQVLRGEIVDPTFLPVLFGAAPDADWRAEETWRAANPNYGVSVKPDYMRAEAEKARRSPRAESYFKRFHLNIWTEQAVRWLPIERPGWRGCTQAPDDPLLWRSLPAEMALRVCYGGLDLSLTRDLSSLCLLFPPRDARERWTAIWRFWLPRAAVEEQPIARRVRYERFAEMGALTLTDDNVVDYPLIRETILADAKAFDLQWLGIDRYNASQLAGELREQHGLPVEWFGQGYLSMSPACKQLERLVIAEQLEHGSNPVAAWMARNAAVERDAADNIKPTKPKAADKIDGIVALAMAVGGATTKPPKQPSVYETRGLLVIGA